MKRSNCPITCALDIIGDKWTLILLRDALFAGKTTYGEFQSSSEGISTNILASRLKHLVKEGIFEKRQDEQNKLIIHYIPTAKGRSLESVLGEIANWGLQHIDGTYSPIHRKIE